MSNSTPRLLKPGAGGHERRKALYGRLFILPWFIGFVFFFAIPLVTALYYTFCKIRIGADGLVFEWVGFENYIYLFTKDPKFVPAVTGSVLNIIYQVPIIVFFSMFVAIILKEDFFGRSFMRAVFFFPVIISSGVVITILRENVLLDPSSINSIGGEGSIFQSGNIKSLLITTGMGTPFVNALMETINRLFDLTWKTGVQTLLILAALHGIPASMYEAANIEGATGWEKFWKITFPLISPTFLLAIIYSIIDYFTDYGNQVIRMIKTYTENGNFEYSTTMGMVYFALVMVIIGVVTAVLNRYTFYMVD